MWGGFNNSDIFSSIERMHCRAVKIIFNLARYMPSAELLEFVQCSTLYSHYILDVFKHIHRSFNDRLLVINWGRIIKRETSLYALRAHDSLVVPRFKTRYMKHSIAYRGAALWNSMIRVTKHLAHLVHKNAVKTLILSDDFINFKFNVTSISTRKLRCKDFVTSFKSNFK